MKLGAWTALSFVSCAALASVSACASSSSSSSVAAIAVSPSPCAVTRTNSIQMSAMATLPDGTKQDITDTAGWSTGDSNTATVNATGTLVGVNPGVTKVVAEYKGASGSIDCTVSP